jgi:very-short-patch-repair endonuclease
MPEQPDPCGAVSAWITVLASSRDLVGDASTWLAALNGLEAAELRSRVRAMTRHDFDRFWAVQPLDSARDPRAVACQELLACQLLNEPVSAGRLCEQLAATLSTGPGTDWPAVLCALAGLIPAAALPGLIYARQSPHENPGLWLSAASRTLTSLAVAAPAVPLALAAPAQTVAAFLHSSPESRGRSLLREGLVTVEGLSETAVTVRLQAAGTSVPEDTVRRLAAEGASNELVDLLAEAASRSGRSETAAQEEKARSAAEVFLFEMLESLAQTAGLFRLNRPLEFRHGKAAAEADLVAEAFRLVIELDGGYYHLADQAAYRRDRRKDWEYQRYGYLVLRFLSDDVVTQLEEILETILAAVAHRRELPPGQGVTP